MRIEAFIQARMNSTRLPGKVLKKVAGKPMLEFLIERLRDCKEIKGIVVLTTDQIADDPIISLCQEQHVSYFRGSEEDVLERYYQAALERGVDGIVRITSDCPLIDPEIVDRIVRAFRYDYPHVDYVSNTLERTFPRGLDVEVFSFKALEKAFYDAIYPEEREHVTVYLYRHPEKFYLKNISHDPSLGHHRWTVDTEEDFTLIKLIVEHLYPLQSRFRFKNVLNLLSAHPDWVSLNAHIEQKTLPHGMTD